MSIRKFTVKRSKWLRGIDDGTSSLLDGETGKMCCLGFLSKACGVRRPSMAGVAAPCALSDCNRAKLPGFLFDDKARHMQSGEAYELMGVNDSETASDYERESMIAAAFRKHGITVTFED